MTAHPLWVAGSGIVGCLCGQDELDLNLQRQVQPERGSELELGIEQQQRQRQQKLQCQSELGPERQWLCFGRSWSQSFRLAWCALYSASAPDPGVK